MPEISEQVAALAAQVASLSSALAVARRRIDDLEEGMTDHLGLDWGESLVDVNSPHPNISANTIESGGGVIRQDANGMQVNASATSIVLRLVEELASDPNLLEEVGRLWGTVFGDSVTFYHDAINTGGFGRLLTTATSTGHEAYLRTFSPYADASMGLSDDTGGAIAYVAGARFLFAQCTLSPGAITGDEDDFNPTGLPNTTILRLSTDASHNVTGLAGGSDGRLLLIFNVGSFDIVLKDEDAGSTAANRFALNGDITLQPDDSVILWYDATSSRWRAV